MSSPVILILGAGPKIGQSVAGAFAAKGYKVAVAARSIENGIGDNGYLGIKLDLSVPANVESAFTTVTEKLGIPSVVVYNAAQRVARDAEDPLASITPEALQQDFAINALSPLLAAQEAVKGFKQLDDSASKTFIFTGNLLNEDWLVRPDVLTFASSKTAAAKWIKYASVAYKSKGFKFYFADERQQNGGPSIPVDGPAAAEAYVELAEDKEQRPWQYTFVKGKGYVDFSDFRGGF